MRSKTTLKPDIYQLVSLCGGLSHSTYTKESHNLGRVIHKPGIERRCSQSGWFYHEEGRRFPNTDICADS
uniref:Uncharacterized protein n=1 Tax=Brassica campestris TaxID=3711 RepID=A0A3P5ZCP7_BRACM|nr:unnamed protein product [Brassica rapa]